MNFNNYVVSVTMSTLYKIVTAYADSCRDIVKF